MIWRIKQKGDGGENLHEANPLLYNTYFQTCQLTFRITRIAGLGQAERQLLVCSAVSVCIPKNISEAALDPCVWARLQHKFATTLWL